MSLLDDFEEAEGLTKEMVRSYLERTWWTVYANGTWKRGKNEDVWLGEDLNIVLRGLRRVTGLSIQQLLRGMNPRMRKACPTQAARQAHPGHWLAMDPAGAGYLVRFDERRRDDPGFEVYRSSGDGRPQSDPFCNPGCSYNVSDFQGGLAGWSFWPCDAFGNKVPWPTADAGKGKAS